VYNATSVTKPERLDYYRSENRIIVSLISNSWRARL